MQTHVSHILHKTGLRSPPTTNTGSNDADLVLRDAGQFAKFLRHRSGNWLLDKILHHLPADDPGPGTVPAFTALIDQLATDFVDVITFADSTWKLLETSLVDVNSPTAFSQTEMTTWFGVLDKTVNSVVALLEAIAETVIDVMKVALEWMLDTLDYQIPKLPADFQYTLIGQIFKLASIDPTISVSHLVSLVVAYPATLINALHGTGPLFPATTSDAADGDRMVATPATPGWKGSGSSPRSCRASPRSSCASCSGPAPRRTATPARPSTASSTPAPATTGCFRS